MRGRLAAVLIVVALSLTSSACFGNRSLTAEEVDSRAQDYYQHGLDLLARNELRSALENFQMAKAYDSSKQLTELPGIIEKTQARLRAGGGAVASAGRSAASASNGETAPPPVPAPGDEPFQTFRSRLYPYSIGVPESWSVQNGGGSIQGARADLFLATRGGTMATAIAVAAHRLPSDLDARGYLETHLKALRADGLNPQMVGERQIGGMTGWLVRTVATNEQGTIVNTMAVFGEPGVGWSILLTAPKQDSERLQPFFQKVLDSYHYGALVSS